MMPQIYSVMKHIQLWESSHQCLNDVLVTKPGDKDVVKKSNKESLSTRYQDEYIEVILSVAMYLDQGFKKGPMLTAKRKAIVKSHLN